MSKLDNIQTICDNCEYAPALDETCKQRVKDLMLELIGGKAVTHEPTLVDYTQGYNEAKGEFLKKVAEL